MLNNNKINVAGLVVTFNPTEKQIKNLIKTSTLFDKLIVVDNSCDKKIHSKLKKIKSKKIHLFFNQCNFGIGYSNNLFFNYLKSANKFNWCMLLDQDTEIEVDLKKLISFLSVKKVKIAGLNFKLSNFKNNQNNVPVISEKRRIIQSGMILNHKIFKEFTYDENLFLDMTDFGFCEKLKLSNIKIYFIENYFIKHKVGKTKNNHFLLFKKKRTNHPPINCFLMSRNRIILAKNNLYKRKIANIIFNQFIEILFTFIFEKNVIKKVKARLKGIFYGLRGDNFKDINSIKTFL